MSAHSSLARPRRAFTALVVAALAGLGLAVVPNATAATVPNTSADPVATISPTTVTNGATQTFAITMQGGTSHPVAAFRVRVPAVFSSPSLKSFTSTVANWTSSLDPATNTYTFVAPGNSAKIPAGGALVANIEATAPTTSGSYTWPVSWDNNTNLTSLVAITPAPSVTVGVVTQPQSIDFPAIGTHVFTDAPFALGATASSSLPVSYATTGPCSESSGTLTITGAGTCKVTASQAGNSAYDPASPVERSFTILKADQTITFPGVATLTYPTTTATLAASSTGPVAIAYATSAPCSVSGSTLTFAQAGTCQVTASQAGNANYNAATDKQITVTMNKAEAHLSLDGLSATYDGQPHPATVVTDPEGLSGVTVTYDGSTTVPTHAGSYEVLATLDHPNYGAEQVGGTLVIGTRPVSAHFAVEGKTYDGTTAATLSACSLTGQVDGDAVDLDCGSAAFLSPNAGEQEAELSGYGLTGSARENYTLTAPGAVTAAIDQKTLGATVQVGDQGYDAGTIAHDVSASLLPGVVSPDHVDVDVTSATFVGKDTGPKVVTVTLALTGADRANYRLDPTTYTDDMTVFAVPLTVSFHADDKVYDGGDAAVVYPDNPLSGIVGDEHVTLSASDGHFADKLVGTAKRVTATLSLEGDDAGNYEIANPGAFASADITARSVTGTFTSADKVYDGGTSAAANDRALTGVLGDDHVTLTGGTASFADKTVGTGKTVTLTGATLDGTDAGNYDLTSVDTTTADITAASVTGSFTSADKVYDGGTSAAANDRALTGVLGDDDVSLTGGTASFADKNVGTGKTVTLTGATLGGTDAGNYDLTSVDTTTADITAKQLTATVTADDKIYDDTTTATVHPTLGGVVAGDAVSAGATGTFSSKYVGTWDVTASVSISGDDAGNYTLTGGPWRTTASIRPLYLGTGFYKPVDMTPFNSTTVYNSVKGGQTVPLKFEVFANGTEQKSVTDVFGDTTAQAAAFRVAQISCSPYGSVGDVDFTTTGGTALRFDNTADQFVQNWKTPTQLGCYSVTIKAKDGGTTLGPAYFKVTK